MYTKTNSLPLIPPSRPPLQVRLGGTKLLALVARGCEDDIVLEVEGGLVVALEGLEVHDKIVLDGEDGVGS